MPGNKRINCPVCGEHFYLENDMQVGDTAYCVDCDNEFEIISLEPPKLRKIVEFHEVCSDDYRLHRYRSHYANDYEDEDSDYNDHVDGYEGINNDDYKEDI